MVDFYRNRLKNAGRGGWNCKCSNCRNNPHNVKDCESGRAAKRSARNEEKREIEFDVINGYPNHWDDYDCDDWDEFQPLLFSVEPLKVPLIEIASLS